MNLLPFVQSLVNGDAPEIDHEEVLWNLTSELIDRIDVVFDNVQSRIKNDLDEGDLITSDVIDTVNTLRTLRHFIREVARREEIRHIVKGSSEDSDVIKKSDEHNFAMLVDDVDMVCACVMYILFYVYHKLLFIILIKFIFSVCMSSATVSQRLFLSSKLVEEKRSRT